MFGYITVNKKQLSDEQIKTYQDITVDCAAN